LRPLSKLLCILIAAAGLLSAATIKLYLRDGSYQIAREYQVAGDRVRYFAAERGEWEEIPLDLVDLKKTEAEVREREQTVREQAKVTDEEEKAERDAAREVARVPVEAGAYLIEGETLKAIPQGESKVVNDKRRNVLKAMSPLPLITGKATVEIDGAHSKNVTAALRPEFYFRLAAEERFGIVKLGEHKGNRVVEKLTIIPVTKEVMEEPDLVEVFRKQETENLYKIWPTKPLAAGEYAIVEYTEGKLNMQVWDFAVAPVAK
jgi:hypothetical protein